MSRSLKKTQTKIIYFTYFQVICSLYVVVNNENDVLKSDIMIYTCNCRIRDIEAAGSAIEH